MKTDHRHVTDEQVIEKTGKPLAHWTKVLKEFDASLKKAAECVKHLQNDHGVPRHLAHTLNTGFLKSLE